jgi:hypothetical protein
MGPLNTDACVKIAACICGKDGILSEEEVREIFNLIRKQQPDYDEATFEHSLDDFFDSTMQIEDYLALVTDSAVQKFILDLAKESASVDGLDPFENIALQKAQVIWGATPNA